ncbi:hypothetical protein PHYBOEH_008658 [Phytophthora boehmeriae]|uniref:Uncharacterized protein n=1 Tax=Phytophthora boehmeriae TaxID=109152 RepID=A0A8T1X667_9STRA|nr:hypothetical protein PHYBOEH_008658 [Phytophthora boehmeriae]
MSDANASESPLQTESAKYWKLHDMLRSKYQDHVEEVYVQIQKYLHCDKETEQSGRQLLSYLDLCVVVLSENKVKHQPRTMKDLKTVCKYIANIVNPYLKTLAEHRPFDQQELQQTQEEAAVQNIKTEPTANTIEVDGYWRQHAVLRGKHLDDVVRVRKAFQSYIDGTGPIKMRKLRFLLRCLEECAVILSEDKAFHPPRTVEDLDKVNKYIKKIVTPYQDRSRAVQLHRDNTKTRHSGIPLAPRPPVCPINRLVCQDNVKRLQTATKRSYDEHMESYPQAKNNMMSRYRKKARTDADNRSRGDNRGASTLDSGQQNSMSCGVTQEIKFKAELSVDDAAQYWQQHAVLQAAYLKDIQVIHTAFVKRVGNMKVQSNLRCFLSQLQLLAGVLSEDKATHPPRTMKYLARLHSYIVKIVDRYLNKCKKVIEEPAPSVNPLQHNELLQHGSA